MLNLVLSLLFGAGQVVAGALLVRYGLREGRWRKPSIYLAMLFGVWFATSGLAELLVSGMETARRLFGGPSAAAFALWRGRADRALLLVTVAVVCAALLYPLVLRLAARIREARG